MKVVTGNFTSFVNLSGLAALSGPQPIPLRVVGLILKDPASGQQFIAAARVAMLQ